MSLDFCIQVHHHGKEIVPFGGRETTATTGDCGFCGHDVFFSKEGQGHVGYFKNEKSSF